MIELLKVPKHIKLDQSSNDYKFVKHLGEGSFGDVSEVIEIATNQHYALKKVDKAAYKDESDQAKILNEVQHLIILSPHPFICSIYSIFEDKKYFYIVQELCGKTLIKAVDNASLEQKIKWFYQLVVAIDFCHRRKILHLDLKPENILVSSNNNIKVIDFGVSQFEERVVHEEVGTVDFLPPEIMRSDDVYVSKASDLWALGVIAYEMFTGQYPFGKSLRDIMHNVLEAKYDPSPLPIHIRPIVEGLLQVDYNERWTTVDILNYMNSL